MQTLEILMIVGLSLGILFFVLMLVMAVLYILTTKQLRGIEKKKPRRKAQKRNWRRTKERLADLKRGRGRQVVLFFVITLAIGGGVGYTKYYQLTNMTISDTKNIVDGYFLIEKAEEQIQQRVGDEIDGVKLNENIHHLSVRMASFASKRANNSASVEGQQLLNRYYAQVGQLGMNLASEQFADGEASKEILTTYLEDIEKAQKSQKSVLTFYKVEEASLKGKK